MYWIQYQCKVVLISISGLLKLVTSQYFQKLKSTLLICAHFAHLEVIDLLPYYVFTNENTFLPFLWEDTNAQKNFNCVHAALKRCQKSDV